MYVLYRIFLAFSNVYRKRQETVKLTVHMDLRSLLNGTDGSVPSVQQEGIVNMAITHAANQKAKTSNKEETHTEILHTINQIDQNDQESTIGLPNVEHLNSAFVENEEYAESTDPKIRCNNERKRNCQNFLSSWIIHKNKRRRRKIKSCEECLKADADRKNRYKYKSNTVKVNVGFILIVMVTTNCLLRK